MIVTITRFENTDAIMTTQDGYEIKFPIAKLPANCLVGAKIKINLSSELDDEREQKKLAKNILNELLNIDSSPDAGTNR